jgi:hypothetical protein
MERPFVPSSFEVQPLFQQGTLKAPSVHRALHSALQRKAENTLSDQKTRPVMMP